MTNIYEADEFSRLPEHSMHPGGLRLTDRAIRLSRLKKDMSVADIGCGAGSTVAYLSRNYGLKMVGVDISEPLIRLGFNKSYGQHFIRWDCRTLPFEPDSLDGVLFECSMSVIGYAANTLEECALALRKNGILIISDLLSKKRTTRSSELPTLSALKKRLTRAGFDIILSEDHTPALVTYAAELKEQFGKSLDAACLLGRNSADGFKLSEHCYHLIIARKKTL